MREIVQIATRLPHHLKRYLMLQARFLRSIEEELVVNPESAVAYVELPNGRVIDVPAEGIPVDLDEEAVRAAIREALEKKAGE